MKDFSMVKKLDKYLNKAYSSFHTPGHKGNFKEFNKSFDFTKYDLTELKDTGSLFDGEGLTLEAEKAMTNFYKTKGSFFSTGGCTLPIQAMLRLALPEGGKILCSRVIHRSAVNAMALLGISPVWLLPDMSAGAGFSGRINAQDVRLALEKDKDIKALYITSPDYFGVMSDIKALSLVCQEFDIDLLVDNAHGSHLKFLTPSLHPIQNGATMSADSAHKTLPVLTGGAILHVMKEDYLPLVRGAMSLFASTSPSYPVMASLDLCRQWLQDEGTGAFESLAKKIGELEGLFVDAGFSLPQGTKDRVRISAYTGDYIPKDISLLDFFRGQGIEPEYASKDKLILIFSPFNKDEDFKRLKQALEAYKILDRQKNDSPPIKNTLPTKKMELREAVLQDSQVLPVSGALGKFSAEPASLCPPGIPILVPGELIDEDIIKSLRENSIKTIRVVKNK